MSDLTDDLAHGLRDAVRTELVPMFDDMRRFVDRRIAELSMEVHATVQMVDFSEANLTGQLDRIHNQIAQVVAAPAAATRNSGLELEAVVHATESAATRIMEAAEAIGTWLQGDRRDEQSIQDVAHKLNDIFEACSFQDLTGQRIRRAIEHLQKVEVMLEGMTTGHHHVPPATAEPEPEFAWGSMGTSTAPTAEGHDLAQDEIDSLFD